MRRWPPTSEGTDGTKAAHHRSVRSRAGPGAPGRWRAPLAGPASSSRPPPDSRRLAWAETVAVGPHVRAIKPGDKVLFNPEDRFEVEVQGEEYVILRERDIHAVASERIDSGTGLYL